MKSYTYKGILYYYDLRLKEYLNHETTITIEAPSAKVADATVLHYSMGLKRVKS